MRHSPLRARVPMLCLASTWLLLAAVSWAAGPQPPAKPPNLPNSTVLARVNDRTVTVLDFRAGFFSSDPEFRPSNDSTGRAQFLENLINKEVLALAAREANPRLGSLDEADLRDFGRVTLSNVLYRRFVSDSVSIREEELKRVYEQYGWELHLRHVLFDDLRAAESVREALVRKKLTWEEAVKKYSIASKDVGPHGDMGWIRRAAASGSFGIQAFQLEPGSLSPVLGDIDGFHVIQVVGKRKTDPPTYESIRRLIRRTGRAGLHGDGERAVTRTLAHRHIKDRDAGVHLVQHL